MKESSDPSVLIVSYAFPPTGGSGVQRAVKFMKYLPRNGVMPHALTARGVLGHTSDSSMLSDLHPQSRVYRTISIDPLIVTNWMNGRRKRAIAGSITPTSSVNLTALKLLYAALRTARDYLRIPDQYIGWFPSAVIKGILVVRENPNTVVLATIPVYTTALVALAISKVTGAPLLLDFRDGWADDPYVHHPTKFHRRLSRKLEGIVMKHASRVIVYGQWLADRFEEHYPGKSVHVLLNGFDPEDIAEAEPVPQKKKKFRLVYSGTVFEYHNQFIDIVFQALEKLENHQRENLELVFVGDIELLAFNDLVKKYNLQETITKVGYVKHRTALGYLHSADALLFTIPNHDVSSYSGKIFEYLGIGKPIISLVYERGCAAELLRQFGQQETIVGYSVERMLAILKRIENISSTIQPPSEETLNSIRRDKQAAVLASIVREIATAHRKIN